MSTTADNPTKNYSRTVRTGGDAPHHQIAIGAAIPAGVVIQGFMLTVDGEFDYTTDGGEVITDPAGTWIPGVQYAMCIKSVQGSTTAQGKLFY